MTFAALFQRIKPSTRRKDDSPKHSIAKTTFKGMMGGRSAMEVHLSCRGVQQLATSVDGGPQSRLLGPAWHHAEGQCEQLQACLPEVGSVYRAVCTMVGETGGPPREIFSRQKGRKVDCFYNNAGSSTNSKKKTVCRHLAFVFNIQ